MSQITKQKTRIPELEDVKKQIGKLKGEEYWRSLEELSGTKEFEELLHNEFPKHAVELKNTMSRRSFMKVMGAALAFAGLTQCAPLPFEKIVPYVKQPEEIVPGKPLFFASAFVMNGVATGVLVESHMGRPTKIEGNPEHPTSLGASDIFSQASILSLYDPDRSQAVIHSGQINSWSNFVVSLRNQLAKENLTQGQGLRILTGASTSPSLGHQIEQVLAKYPKAKWFQYEPAGRQNALQGAKLAFGEYLNTYYDLSKAQVILSLDSDFLSSHPRNIKYIRDFSAKRQASPKQKVMNRLYCVESSVTGTGASADHRWPIKASDMLSFVKVLASKLGVAVAVDSSYQAPAWLDVVVDDLKKNQGRGAVMVGEHQSPEIHALVYVIQEKLGYVGRSVRYTEALEPKVYNHENNLESLVQEMRQGQVKTLLILNANPVYNTPSDLKFSEALQNVSYRAHLGLYRDETAHLCHWHIPQAHDLEAWTDARAYDGTVTIVQPLIKPLYQGKSIHNVLAEVIQSGVNQDYDVVKEYWKSQRLSAQFSDFWRKALHDGLVSGTKAKMLSPVVKLNFASLKTSNSNQGLEVNFRPDPSVYDGSFANNGWLQELPKPISKLTWDNAALLSPKTAKKLGVKKEDVIKITHKGQSLEVPVWVQPGQPEDSMTLYLGYGRTRAGKVGNGVGVNVYQLLSSKSWFLTGVDVQKTGKTYALADTQNHHLLDGRGIVRSATLETFLKNPDFAHEGGHLFGEKYSLYPEYEYEGNAWGMVVNLSSCVGCNACTIACQAENNIPTVGKEEVRRGREMHWIRIDHYYKGDMENPESYQQPMMCQHCEKAPCEVVCPVNATTHSSEGLNEMVYNRCVGTRYCSNNCPYKVRRFNFFEYANWKDKSLESLYNPDVTVRQRGVMEKCTYCVQRIAKARIEARKENRDIRENDLQTACQQVCPAEAIVFGDINNPKTKVAQMKTWSTNYGALEELNTVPRTSYLAAVRNPNPKLVKEKKKNDHHKHG